MKAFDAQPTLLHYSLIGRRTRAAPEDRKDPPAELLRRFGALLSAKMLALLWGISYLQRAYRIAIIFNYK